MFALISILIYIYALRVSLRCSALSQAPVDFSKVFGPQDEEPVKRRRAARSSSSSSSSSSGSDSSDSDSSDLDTEEEAARAKKAAYDAKTAANVAKEQSTVIFDIKPEDTDVDLDELAQSIYGVNCEGLEWGREHQIIPLAFGLKMLKVACIIRNVLVSTDWMEETISELPGVGSVEIAAFNKI